MPMSSRYTEAAARPTASAIAMVPASNFQGTSFHLEPLSVTSRIISPPPRNGGMDSSSERRAPSAPMPLRRHRDETQLDPTLRGQDVPGDEVRVVLHLRQ